MFGLWRNPPYVRSTLVRVIVYSLLMALYAATSVLKEESSWKDFADLPTSLSAALSVIVSVLLVFRTNSAYAKWWEARTLWGALINASRNLAIKVRHFVPISRTEKERLAQHLAVFAYTLKDHLRHINDLKQWPGFEDVHDELHHAPSLVVSRIYALIETWRKQGAVPETLLRVLDIEARVLLEVCGGCERIHNTRLAFSYRLFINSCVFLYLLILPWGLVNEFHGWTILMVFVLSFFLIGLEVVAHSIESPFGHDDDDLDLDGLCATLERSVQEILPGEAIA
jgi:putative membrane protein